MSCDGLPISERNCCMKILISNTSNLAIYEQIIRQIKDAVIAKEIQAGEMLPSIRSLANAKPVNLPAMADMASASSNAASSRRLALLILLWVV